MMLEYAQEIFIFIYQLQTIFCVSCRHLLVICTVRGILLWIYKNIALNIAFNISWAIVLVQGSRYWTIFILISTREIYLESVD